MQRSLLGILALAAAGAAACFSPTYPQGLACGDEGECPPGQECDQASGTCVSEAGGPDAGIDPGDPDAAGDPDAGTDPDSGAPDGAELSFGEPLDFGDVPVGDEAISTLQLENVGEEATGEITFDLVGDGDEAFELSQAAVEECAPGLDAGDGCELAITFRPPTDEPWEAELEASADPGGAVSTPIQGEGAPLSLEFEQVEPPCQLPADRIEVASFARVPTLVGVFASERLLWLCNTEEGDVRRSFDAPLIDLFVGDVTGGENPEIAVARIDEAGAFIQVDNDLDLQVNEFEVPRNADPTFVTGHEQRLVYVSESLVVMAHEEEGEFEPEFENSSLAPAQNASFANFSGSGDPDVVKLEGERSPLTYAPAPYDDESAIPVEVGGGATGSLTPMRADADSLADVIVDTFEGAALIENEDGELGEAIELDIPIEGPLTAGDVTGDGRDELIGVHPSGEEGVVYVRDGLDFELAGVFRLPGGVEDLAVGALTGTDIDIAVALENEELAVFSQSDP